MHTECYRTSVLTVFKPVQLVLLEHFSYILHTHGGRVYEDNVWVSVMLRRKGIDHPKRGEKITMADKNKYL